MSAPGGRRPQDPAAPLTLVLPVGHRLGPLFDVRGGTSAALVVRRGREVVHLGPDEAAAWELARPEPGPTRPGDAAAVDRRLVDAGLSLDLLDRLLDRGLLVGIDPRAADPSVAAGLRARPLGSAQGGDPARDTVALGPLGSVSLTFPGRDLVAWTAATGAPDLWTATALLHARWNPTAAEPAGEPARTRLLELLWLVVPTVLAGSCGYLDVAG